VKKRNILYISGTRADYGLMRQALFAIKKHPRLQLRILATGMHVMPEFGFTLNEIKRDGFRVYVSNIPYKNNDKKSTVIFMGKFIHDLSGKLSNIKPDIILLLGDRAEMLAGAIAGAYLSIPVAHIHGGDVTSTVDELARHAITKLSSLHFAATKAAADRILKMGEEQRRVFKVGSPGLDSIMHEKLLSREQAAKKYKLDLSKKIILVLQHPVTMEVGEAKKQMRLTMQVIKDLGFQSIVIYPNADAGSRDMVGVINSYRSCSFMRIYKSIPRRDYLSLMGLASVLVGNSSSGIIEAPLFGLPVVNIGSRQQDRERSNNVLDVAYSKEKIKKAILRALYDKQLLNKIRKIRNIYGDGKSGARIAGILAKIKISKNLSQKQLTY